MRKTDESCKRLLPVFIRKVKLMEKGIRGVLIVNFASEATDI